MNTKEAIEEAIKNRGKKINLLSLEDTYIYTKDGLSFSLIIKGSFSLGFLKEHYLLVDQDLEYYTKSIYWLPVIKQPNTGTTITHQNAWRRAEKVLFK